jgi:hypothetical protein
MIGINGYFNFTNKYNLSQSKSFIENKETKNYTHNYLEKNFYINYLNKKNSEDHFIKKDTFFLVLGNISKLDNAEVSPSHELSNYYSKNNLEEFVKKNGSFIFLIKDRNKIIIGCDENCYLPLYYYYSKDFFIFSYDIFQIKNIIPFSLDANLQKMSEIILTSDVVLDDESKIKNINRLLAGNIIIANSFNKKIIPRKFFFYKTKNYNHSIEYHIENVADKLSNAIKNIKENKIGIGLSGGIDSRILISSLKKNQKKVFPHIYGIKNFNEIKIAKSVSKLLKLNLTYIEVKKKNYFESFNNFSYISNFECPINTSPQYHIYKSLKKLGDCNTLSFGSFLDCTAGDNFFNEKMLSIKNKNELKEFYINQYIFKFSLNEFTNFFLNKNLAKNAYESCKYKIENILNKIDCENIFDINASFFFETRGKRRYNLNLIYPLYFFNINIPFYDKYFLKSLSEIPFYYRMNDKFRVKLLNFINKKASKINYNKSLKPADLEFPLNKKYIEIEKRKEDYMYKKWVKFKFNKKYSSSTYDANFLEWLISDIKFFNFFKNLILYKLKKNFLNKSIIYNILVNLKKNKHHLKNLLTFFTIQYLIIIIHNNIFLMQNIPSKIKFNIKKYENN